MSLPPDLPSVLKINVTTAGTRVRTEPPRVAVAPTDTRVIVALTPGPSGGQGPAGPPGPQGPPGDGDTVAWHFGSGPPGTIVGASPGDVYMDVDNGTLYRLGD